MPDKVLVVIGDLVASRAALKRGKLQTDLKKALVAASRRNKEGLLSPYTLTLGDEFQAVYGDPAGLFRDLLGISAAIYPHAVRYSVAVGSLVTPINRVRALEMDGPAFHDARDEMERLKTSTRSLAFAGELGPWRELLNGALGLATHGMAAWRKNRYLILLHLLENRSRREIAEATGISEVAVHKNIHAAALHEMVTFFSETEGLLKTLLKT